MAETSSSNPQLPDDPAIFVGWNWDQYEPYVRDLLQRPLDGGTLATFLDDWTAFTEHVQETYSRRYHATVQNTADQGSTAAYTRFIEDVVPQWERAEQRLKERFLAAGFQPDGFEQAARKMQAEVEFFREQNLPLLTEEQKLEENFNRVIGSQTVHWEGRDVPLPQMTVVLQERDRSIREAAWRAMLDRQLADREELTQLWRSFLQLRCTLAANADRPEYRSYRWRQMLRFDYTPEDCLRFDDAIAQVVVPAAERVLARRRQSLGVTSIRPWDLAVDPQDREPLRPFQAVDELIAGGDRIFNRVDEAFGAYFQQMADAGTLDLPSRLNKGPGGFCDTLRVSKDAFIFMNAVGTHDDVQTLLHEGGHAFHAYEAMRLRWSQQQDVGLEFAEVASMAMELLASPYLTADAGGFYSAEDARRARIQHLESIILFWPYMAVVDSFQHWVYTHPEEAAEGAALDEQWAHLYRQYHPAEDWSGLEAELMTGWQRKPHIFSVPFYYVEYGLAQLGAVQVWANARRDQAQAVAAYRRALALGGTRSIADLYAAAGARLAFDAATLRQAVELVEHGIEELSAPA